MKMQITLFVVWCFREHLMSQADRWWDIKASWIQACNTIEKLLKINFIRICWKRLLWQRSHPTHRSSQQILNNDLCDDIMEAMAVTKICQSCKHETLTQPVNLAHDVRFSFVLIVNWVLIGRGSRSHRTRTISSCRRCYVRRCDHIRITFPRYSIANAFLLFHQNPFLFPRFNFFRIPLHFGGLAKDVY